MPTKPSSADAAAAAHPLRGIVNTNDDPTCCALCSDDFPLVGSMQEYCCHVAHCCGKMFCIECIHRITGDSEYTCVMCGHNWTANPFALDGHNKTLTIRASRDLIGTMKKNAKKDLPWSQYQLGWYWEDERAMDTTKLLRKAARKNHPAALLSLGQFWRDGFGCKENLEEARRCIDEGMALDFRLAEEGKRLLVSIAENYVSNDALGPAREILEPITRENNGTCATSADAKYQMGRLVFVYEDDYKTALEWFSSAYFSTFEFESKDGDRDRSAPAHSAMVCCQFLNAPACAKFWMASAKMMPSDLDIKERMGRVRIMVSFSRTLRSIRDTCGGCGVEFEGKERKFCRGCRAVCYCSRDCQKMHWNRKKDNHREDCKAATELKRKLKEARKKAATGVAAAAASSL